MATEQEMNVGLDEKIRIGVDLGGTKIEIVALDAQGRELLRTRVPTPESEYQAIIDRIVDLVFDAESRLGRSGSVGIGTPGAFSKKTGCIKNANSQVLNGKPLRDDLERALDREIRIANDADCFTLSEFVDGAAAGSGIVFGVILGTGVGGGIVANGKLLAGPNSIAGEWGHNPLPRVTPRDQPLPPCYCGSEGCIETFLSGPGLSRDHRLNFGRDLDAETIVRQAQKGDADCLASMGIYQDRLARALALVINILDPDVIVLGGGLSNCWQLYRVVPWIWTEYVFSDRVDTRLVAPRHGDSSGVRGAARLWGGEWPGASTREGD